MNKKKLKEILLGMSSDSEKHELEKLDSSKIKEIVQYFDEQEAEHEGNIGKLLSSFDSYTRAVGRHNKELIESFSGFGEQLSKKLEEMGGTISTSYEKHKPVNAAGVYKDMINQLASIDKSVKDKPVPVWNWPQYAGVSVRNKNFSNINPAIQGFGLDDFDEVQLSNYTGTNVGTVTYLLNGTITAVLALSYDGSGNLTDVIRTQ